MSNGSFLLSFMKARTAQERKRPGELWFCREEQQLLTTKQWQTLESKEELILCSHSYLQARELVDIQTYTLSDDHHPCPLQLPSCLRSQRNRLHLSSAMPLEKDSSFVYDRAELIGEIKGGLPAHCNKFGFLNYIWRITFAFKKGKNRIATFKATTENQVPKCRV